MNNQNITEVFSDIANSIRDLSGSTEQISPTNMATKISNEAGSKIVINKNEFFAGPETPVDENKKFWVQEDMDLRNIIYSSSGDYYQEKQLDITNLGQSKYEISDSAHVTLSVGSGWPVRYYSSNGKRYYSFYRYNSQTQTGNLEIYENNNGFNCDFGFLISDINEDAVKVFDSSDFGLVDCYNVSNVIDNTCYAICGVKYQGDSNVHEFKLYKLNINDNTATLIDTSGLTDKFFGSSNSTRIAYNKYNDKDYVYAEYQHSRWSLPNSGKEKNVKFEISSSGEVLNITQKVTSNYVNHRTLIYPVRSDDSNDYYILVDIKSSGLDFSAGALWKVPKDGSDAEIVNIGTDNMFFNLSGDLFYISMPGSPISKWNFSTSRWEDTDKYSNIDDKFTFGHCGIYDDVNNVLTITADFQDGFRMYDENTQQDVPAKVIRGSIAHIDLENDNLFSLVDYTEHFYDTASGTQLDIDTSRDVLFLMTQQHMQDNMFASISINDTTKLPVTMIVLNKHMYIADYYSKQEQGQTGENDFEIYNVPIQYKKEGNWNNILY